MRKREDTAVIAQQLAAKLLEEGRYVFSSAALSSRALASIMPAAASANEVEPYIHDLGFAGLAVQAVGYEEGAKQPKIHVYVAKGRSKGAQEFGDTGIAVEINRVGRVVVHPETAAGTTQSGNFFQRKGRVACGSSCAPANENYAGTLGALVRKKSGNALYVLSNNHVLAAGNHTPVDMPILSPSPMDSRPGVPAPSEVCRHAEICELHSGVPTLVAPGREDIALARVVKPDIVTSWQGEGPESYDTPAAVAAPRSGMRVKKFGRTTSRTVGTVESFINSPFALPYKFKFFTAVVWLRDVWLIRADQTTDPGAVFALPGDSGSLTVTEKGDAAVGVVFAASPNGEYGFIIPMTHVQTLHGGLTLMTDHGV